MKAVLQTDPEIGFFLVPAPLVQNIGTFQNSGRRNKATLLGTQCKLPAPLNIQIAASYFESIAQFENSSSATASRASVVSS